MAQAPHKCNVAGRVVYQDLPCPAGSSELGSVSTTNATAPSPQDKSNAQNRAKSEQPEQPKTESGSSDQNATAPPPKRTALSFDAYANIRRGMSAQEVLVKGGTPANKEFASSSSLCPRRQLYESWLFPADSTEPNNTVVEFCDGIVADVKRFK